MVMWPAMCKYCEIIMVTPPEQCGRDYLQLMNCIIITTTVHVIQGQVNVILHYSGSGFHSPAPPGKCSSTIVCELIIISYTIVGPTYRIRCCDEQ